MPTVSSNKVAASAEQPPPLPPPNGDDISAPINAGLMPDAFAAYYYDQSKVDPKSKVCCTIFMYINQLNHKSQLEHQNRKVPLPLLPSSSPASINLLRTPNHLPPSLKRKEAPVTRD
jgi:hypothetical protein